jgi:protein-S-isoprenylcysteine O-methyltransferase Ste14
MAEGRPRGPNVWIPPPLLYAIPFATGMVVQHFVPIRIVSGDGPARIIDLVGAAEIFIGASLGAWAVRTFRRLLTPVFPMHPALALADDGPYALTRNPMYLGLAIVYLGIALVANAFWPLLLLPEAIVLTYLFAIRREEAYLAREFGNTYADYRARVRRWI